MEVEWPEVNISASLTPSGVGYYLLLQADAGLDPYGYIYASTIATGHLIDIMDTGNNGSGNPFLASEQVYL